MYFPRLTRMSTKKTREMNELNVNLLNIFTYIYIKSAKRITNGSIAILSKIFSVIEIPSKENFNIGLGNFNNIKML